MSINPNKRKCSVICGNGRPCGAWALIASDPPLCSAHAGRIVGAGAPEGNKNAMKHGLYAAYMKADEVEVLGTIDAKTLVHEVALARIMLRRLARYVNDDALPVDDVVRIVPIILTGARTVAYLMQQIGDADFDWDEVLDDIKDDWDIEI